ncbi:DUF5348 domain-containing protein [Alicyclobacillus ferrooxydans]|uniref:DUF5348 domain-containing protein n=1 Tax=Alicyclobacillus ferrooxydans TaxID=471514 RepID=A0A0P9EXI6_9BACL|nr:DUF5348 domain-containing protein [Alicyclobacillus ferrooxydans]KPV43848.1 hypothetical protein AN477_10790 [Alicyclobacillus ferrooxydans]
MKLKGAQLEYDGELQRWVVAGDGEWYSLHCGDAFHLCIGDKSQFVRLEMARSWYVIADGVALGLIEGRTYRVNIDV